ncbi:hypothetical protein [Shewanella surugensis]|uniref:DUF106 domain-containing protein n=1 Tax=Shewanella surugensis TaxID=212020 RepID=A0ABT0L748_9GAMM|nr:hypothetical protein [Shewanella surugensis]MCL1123315.1 hypothetical protein [Shewanella surugensis]
MSILTSILSIFTNPIADLTGGYRERKRIAAESAKMLVDAEIKLKISKLEAKARRFEQTANNDADYDMQVLKNRNESLMDNVIIFVFSALLIAHFIPPLQPYIAGGWHAMGYKGAPWWFEFIIVGIAVSTLGLMGLFRIFWRQKPNKKTSK